MGKPRISQKMVRGVAVIALELILLALGAMIDADYLTANAHWFLIAGFGLFVAVWFFEQITEFVRWKRGKAKKLTSADDVAATVIAQLGFLNGRRAYADRVLRENKDADLEIWLGKAQAGSQRIALDDLRALDVRDLTLPQAVVTKKCFAIADDLDRLIDGFSKGNGFKNPAHAIGQYLNRVNGLHRSLRSLLGLVSGQGPNPLAFVRIEAATDTPIPRHTALRLTLRNEGTVKLTGLVAELVRAEPQLPAFPDQFHLPLTLATKTRIDKLRSKGEPLPAMPFDLNAGAEKQVEVVWLYSEGSLEAHITHEAGEAQYVVMHSHTLYVQVSGAGDPIEAGLHIEMAIIYFT